MQQTPAPGQWRGRRRRARCAGSRRRAGRPAHRLARRARGARGRPLRERRRPHARRRGGMDRAGDDPGGVRPAVPHRRLRGASPHLASGGRGGERAGRRDRPRGGRRGRRRRCPARWPRRRAQRRRADDRRRRARGGRRARPRGDGRCRAARERRPARRGADPRRRSGDRAPGRHDLTARDGALDDGGAGDAVGRARRAGARESAHPAAPRGEPVHALVHGGGHGLALVPRPRDARERRACAERCAHGERSDRRAAPRARGVGRPRAADRGDPRRSAACARPSPLPPRCRAPQRTTRPWTRSCSTTCPPICSARIRSARWPPPCRTAGSASSRSAGAMPTRWADTRTARSTDCSRSRASVPAICSAAALPSNWCWIAPAAWPTPPAARAFPR